MHAVSDEIERVVQAEWGDEKRGIEGYDESRWIVLDYGDVIVQLSMLNHANTGSEHLWRIQTLAAPERMSFWVQLIAFVPNATDCKESWEARTVGKQFV